MTAKQDYRERLRKHTEESLAQHVVTKQFESGVWQGWRYARTGSWIYGFHVVMGPGFIVLTGDIGDRIWRVFDMDWLLRSSTDDIDRLCTKCLDRGPRVFHPEFAEEVLGELERNGAVSTARAIRNEWDEDEDLRVWLEACWSQELHDLPSCDDYDHDTLWCCYALVHFAEALKKMDANP